MSYQVLVHREKPPAFTPTVVVTGCYCTYQNKFLLLKRALGKPQENTWGVPAGKLEDHESISEAIYRETFEETGIQLIKNQLQYLGELFVQYPHVDFVYHLFHQKFSKLPDVRLSDEHTDYCWVTLEEALDMPLIAGAKEVMQHFNIFI